MFGRPIALRVFNCTTENIHVTEAANTFLEGFMLPSGRMVVSPVVHYGEGLLLLSGRMLARPVLYYG
jgi:hypothetical protein